MLQQNKSVDSSQECVGNETETPTTTPQTKDRPKIQEISKTKIPMKMLQTKDKPRMQEEKLNESQKLGLEGFLHVFDKVKYEETLLFD